MTRVLRILVLVAALAAALSPAARAQEPADSLAAPAAADSSAASVAPDSTPSPARPGPNPALVAGSRFVLLRGRPETVMRTGPGSGFAIAGTAPAGTRLPVIAKSDGWYGVRISGTGTGWVHASLCREVDDLSGLQYRPNPRLYTRTGSYVLSAYGGAYAFDRKSNSAVIGGRVGYYVFDRIVAEAGVSWTHVRREAEIVESLFDLRLEAEDFPMLFYQMNLTWELLPGRQMVPYVGGGVGSTVMLGRSTPAVNFGAGTRLFLSKRAAMRWDVRDYRFEDTSGSGAHTNNNVEFTLGTEYLY